MFGCTLYTSCACVSCCGARRPPFPWCEAQGIPSQVCIRVGGRGDDVGSSAIHSEFRDISVFVTRFLSGFHTEAHFRGRSCRHMQVFRRCMPAYMCDQFCAEAMDSNTCQLDPLAAAFVPMLEHVHAKDVRQFPKLLQEPVGRSSVCPPLPAAWSKQRGNS